MAEVVCPGCGRSYRDLNELANVRSLGLALMGTCLKCGARFGVSELFRVTRRLDAKVASQGQPGSQSSSWNQSRR